MPNTQVTCYLLHVICYLAPVTPVTCYLLPVTCYLFINDVPVVGEVWVVGLIHYTAAHYWYNTFFNKTTSITKATVLKQHPKRSNCNNLLSDLSLIIILYYSFPSNLLLSENGTQTSAELIHITHLSPLRKASFPLILRSVWDNLWPY